MLCVFGEIEVGDNPIFLSKSHSAASAGFIVFRSLIPDWIIYPLQIGQPLLFLVLQDIATCHSCPHRPSHHTFLFDVEKTSLGVSWPFLTGCHSLAISGNYVAKSLNPVSSLWLLHIGQFCPFVRWLITACHSCPQAPSHQTLRPALEVTLLGVNSPFFDGCHSFAMSGNSSAREL